MIENLNMIADRIKADDVGKQDMYAQLSGLRMNESGRVMVKGKSFGMTDYAVGQIFTKLRIPVGYGKRLMAERPDLVAREFNYWVSREPDRRILVRYREGSDSRIPSRDNEIRAFLSDKYARVNNKDMFDALDSIVSYSDQEVNVSLFGLDDHRAHIRLTFPDMTSRFGVALGGQDDDIVAGVDILNSEVGASRLIVSPVVWRLVCSNGMRAWRADGEGLRQRHIHIEPSELRERMAIAMKDSITESDTMIEKLRSTRVRKVYDPYEIIEKLAKKEMYSEDLTEMIQDNFGIEPDYNVYGIINAFTRTARDFDIKHRLNLERLAGKLITDDLLKEFDAA